MKGHGREKRSIHQVVCVCMYVYVRNGIHLLDHMNSMSELLLIDISLSSIETHQVKRSS